MKNIWKRITNWEQWNFFVLYAPLFPVWFWYCIRSRSFWFFSSSNPTITFGGFEGEGKKEMYDQLPPALFPRTIYISPTHTLQEAEQLILLAGFQLPFTVKPDVGMKGLLFRKINSWDQWKAYHQTLTVDYLVQDWLDYPYEYSVFYFRHPSATSGTISGFIQKDLLQVRGDGLSKLSQLVAKHPKAKNRIEELKMHHAESWNTIVPDQVAYLLSHAGNHNRGAQFTNLQHEIDDSLLQVFDVISRQTTFYYGRYDLKAVSVAQLKQGKDFSIIEFNGCGAEPNHIYDCGMSLWQAYGVLLKHWSALYKISAFNHQQGYRYWNFWRGVRFLRTSSLHFKKVEKLDVSGV
jgi:hypothetical protein